MTRTANPDAYRFLAEAMVYPEDRDSAKMASFAEAAVVTCPRLREVMESMLASSQLDDCDIYLETFEIGAKIPLYLGHYLFEEPNNCRGAAISGRNAYMIQLKNLYRHFGLELYGGELPDFLPLLLEFLALTAGHPDQKRRRWMIKHYLLPALPALTKGLTEANNVYTPIAAMVDRLLRDEVEDAMAPEPEALTTAQLCNAT